METISIKGISDRDGKLLISGKDEMRDFLKRNKGRRILIKMEAFTIGSTQAMIGFYKGKIIQDIQKGFAELGDRKSIEEVEDFLHRIYYKELPDDITEIDKKDMIEYIDFVMQFAAENLYVFIPDPRTI